MVVPFYFYILLGVIAYNGVVLIIEDIIELAQVVDNLEVDWLEIWNQLHDLIDNGQESSPEYEDLRERERDMHDTVEERQSELEELRRQESADQSNENESTDTSDQQPTDQAKENDSK